jgi:hypothetical protein
MFLIVHFLLWLATYFRILVPEEYFPSWFSFKDSRSELRNDQRLHRKEDCKLRGSAIAELRKPMTCLEKSDLCQSGTQLEEECDFFRSPKMWNFVRRRLPCQ